ncbi:hypothetical protein Tco_1103517 [Tanacetum coccineum]
MSLTSSPPDSKKKTLQDPPFVAPISHIFLTKMCIFLTDPLLLLKSKMRFGIAEETNLGVYYFSTFKAPKNTINKLKSIRRKFFWGGNLDENKISWIAWKKVISPISHGGIGIGSLKSSNQAMLSKWWCKFRTDRNALWCNIILSIHGPLGGLDDASSLRVPTRSNLDIRGVDLDFVRCPIYDDEIESEEHIFVMCNVAREARKNIFLWRKIDNTSINNLNDVINLADRVSFPTKHLKVFDVLVQTTLWFLWKFRNNVVFSSKRPRKELIFNDIKLYSFVWISNRLRKASIN